MKASLNVNNQKLKTEREKYGSYKCEYVLFTENLVFALFHLFVTRT